MDLFDIMDQISEAALERAFSNMTLEEKISFISVLETRHEAQFPAWGAD